MFDIRFNNPSSILLAGASQSGKSHLIKEIIAHKNEVIKNGNKIQNIIWFLEEPDQDIIELVNKGTITELITEPPSLPLIKEKAMAHPPNTSLFIIDDYMESFNQQTLNYSQE